MKTSLVVSPRRPPRALLAIFWAGTLAGVLDLAFAVGFFVLHGKSPSALLKTVAGGALGRGALQGGPEVAMLGCFFHFFIAWSAAAIYYFASRRWPLVNRYAVPSGLVYGLLIYEVMNLVVLPLSAYHKPVAFPPLLVADVLSHLFFVGLTIALVVRYASKYDALGGSGPAVTSL